MNENAAKTEVCENTFTGTFTAKFPVGMNEELQSIHLIDKVFQDFLRHPAWSKNREVVDTQAVLRVLAYLNHKYSSMPDVNSLGVPVTEHTFK